MVNHNNPCWIKIRKSEGKKLSKYIVHRCIKANKIPFWEKMSLKMNKRIINCQYQGINQAWYLSAVVSYTNHTLSRYQFLHCNRLLIQNHVNVKFNQLDTEYI